MFYSKIRMSWLIVLLAFAISLFGCGPKPIKEESVLDTPENHFSRGMIEFERGNLTAAMSEFERAKALNPNYAEAYSGMGLVYAEQKDFKKALDFANQGISKNDKSVDVHIIKGRIITKQREGDDWIKNAVKEFQKAAELNPRSGKAYYYMGITYKEGYQFGPAADAFRKVIELKGEYSAEADKEWEIVQKIERAAPGTKVGAKVALINEIDRADLAVLLMEELKLMTLLEKKRPKVYDTGFKPPEDVTKLAQPEKAELPEVTDVGNHWAKNWILEIVKARGMEPYPDHTFRPDEKITRANYAMVMQNILIMATGDESIATKYVGEPSRFPDVNSSHYAYNAIALMVDRGIMKADKLTGEFRPLDHISGADALLIIRDFQNALRMEF
ncbi:MAG: tetratricopeptide repeat protein [candidate division KSB1 bacterium]|nr:tetratricopeptide repeat protein [candidate division KSB1 bacterium]